MGHRLAPRLFVGDYIRHVGAWSLGQRALPEASLFYTRDPVFQRMTDLSLSTFVGDVAKTFMAKDPGAGHEKLIDVSVKQAQQL